MASTFLFLASKGIISPSFLNAMSPTISSNHPVFPNFQPSLPLPSLHLLSISVQKSQPINVSVQVEDPEEKK